MGLKVSDTETAILGWMQGDFWETPFEEWARKGREQVVRQADSMLPPPLSSLLKSDSEFPVYFDVLDADHIG